MDSLTNPLQDANFSCATNYRIIVVYFPCLCAFVSVNLVNVAHLVKLQVVNKGS